MKAKEIRYCTEHDDRSIVTVTKLPVGTMGLQLFSYVVGR